MRKFVKFYKVSVPIFLKLLEIFDEYSFETKQQKSIINFAIKTVGLEDKNESFVKFV